MVWVAFISAGSAVFVALMTQSLATLAARKQADRADKKEVLQWQRTEASRLQEQGSARGREFWALVLQSRRCMERRIEGRDAALAPGERSPVEVAAETYAIALFGLAPEIAPLAKEFYQATADLERNLAQVDEAQPLRVLAGIPRWSGAFQRLEEALTALPRNG